VTEGGRFLLEKRSKFAIQGDARVISCDQSNNIMVLGLSNGVFQVYNADTLESVHSFQISESKIDSVTINAEGDWVALGSRELG